MTTALQALNEEAQRLLGMGFRDLSTEERRVIKGLIRRAPVSRRHAPHREPVSSFGQKLADQVAAVGGSWSFIIAFCLILVVWIATNSVLLALFGARPFDPYPFIFLNLILSMVAALQAPVIMMSQNRQAAKDRAAAEHDYEVNLKAELEIMGLHDKLDALRSREIADLLAQQISLLQEIRNREAAAQSH